MKNIVILILLLSISKICHGQYLPSEITFSNGDTFEGLSKITKREKILFKLDKTSTPDVYGPGDLTQIVFYQAKENRIFEFVMVSKRLKRSKFKLMEVIETGKITLYQHYRTKKRFNGSSHGFDNNGFPHRTGQLEVEYIVKKYLKIAGNEVSLSIDDTDNIEYYLSKCFAGCESVLDEMRVVGYEGDKLDDLVWQYNRDCGNL